MRNRKTFFIKVRAVFALFACFAFTAPNGFGQQSGGAEPSANAPGLTLTFEDLKGKRKPDFPDARISRLIALYVPQGATPSPFTPAGPFRATFEGDITVRSRTLARFSAMGRGKLMLSIGGKPVLESSGDDLSKITSEEIRLGKGKNHIVAVYESPQEGDASLRLFWSSKTWQPEPVPPTLFSHATSDPGIARSLAVREGRFLFGQFRCLNCHSAPGLSNPGNKDEMPELGMDAPSLADAGTRFNEAWLAAWIAKPQAVRPDVHMPGLFNRPGAVNSEGYCSVSHVNRKGGTECTLRKSGGGWTTFCEPGLRRVSYAAGRGGRRRSSLIKLHFSEVQVGSFGSILCILTRFMRGIRCRISI